MGLSHSPRIVTNGLVAYWDAGNTRSYSGSGTTWTDLSGNALNGTLSSTTFSSSNGGSLVFNGTTSVSNHGTSTTLDVTTALTLDVWFYAVTYGPLSNGLGRFLERTGGGFGYYFYLINDTPTTVLGFNYAINNGVYFLDGPNTVSLNTWTNLTITHTGSVATSYKNGSLLTTKSVPQPTSSGASTFYIGNRAALDRTFNGNIPSVKVYNRALSDQEVKQNYNALRGRFGI